METNQRSYYCYCYEDNSERERGMSFKTSPKEYLRSLSCVSNKVDYSLNIRRNI